MNATETYSFQHLSDNKAHLGILAELYHVTQPIVAHSHDFWEIAFAVRGSGHHEDDSGRLPILSGDVWIIQPGQWHAYPMVGNTLAIFNLLLSHDFLQIHPDVLRTTHCLTTTVPIGGTGLITPVPSIRLSPQGLDSIYTLLKQLEHELQHPDAPGHTGLCVGLVFQILGLLDRYGSSGPIQSAGAFAARNDPGLLAGVQFIEQNYANTLTLEEIANISGYTLTYFIRKFHQQLGITPIDYLFQIRLQHACSLLKSSDQPIIKIAHTVGFSDSRYFATRFRRTLGLTPSQFRQQAETQHYKHPG